MYAIVSIAGQQFKVEKNSRIFVHRLQEIEGSVTELDKVMLIDNDGKIQIGTPYLKDALVTAKIISHLKGDTVKVFKKKRRKGYQVMNGHRQYFTEIIIDEILEKGASKKAQPKAEPKVTGAGKEPVAEKKEGKADVQKEIRKAASTQKATGPKDKKPAGTQKKAAPKKEVKTAKAAPKTKAGIKSAAKPAGKAIKSTKSKESK